MCSVGDAELFSKVRSKQSDGNDLDVFLFFHVKELDGSQNCLAVCEIIGDNVALEQERNLESNRGGCSLLNRCWCWPSLFGSSGSRGSPAPVKFNFWTYPGVGNSAFCVFTVAVATRGVAVEGEPSKFMEPCYAGRGWTCWSGCRTWWTHATAGQGIESCTTS